MRRLQKLSGDVSSNEEIFEEQIDSDNGNFRDRQSESDEEWEFSGDNAFYQNRIFAEKYKVNKWQKELFRVQKRKAYHNVIKNNCPAIQTYRTCDLNSRCMEPNV
ncbi:hypothetical protein NPIL_344211 [Nephila pilipes]|uniref:Uncharacterized protein n=1 Tax=Nephila pilipes TaxID=299642 RepID=A0A8X6TMN3_NEPPI|nr:hypothetical protein NPIL_344211 [Nephila pilipes]